MRALIPMAVLLLAFNANACVMPATNASEVAWQLFYQCEAAQQQTKR